MLYLAYKGLSLYEIGLMETVYHLTSFTMEIPTGMVADIFGRRTSRILGSIANGISILIMIYSNNVFMFALSFFFTAIGNNLESGAGDALIYDSLKEIHEEELYLKIRGRKELFFQIAKTASLLLGGYIATFSYERVYQVALIIAVITIIQTFTFVEPSIGKVTKQESMFKTFWFQLKNSVLTMLSKKELLIMILALEFFSTLYTTEFFYMQNHLKALGHTTFEIGVILSIGAVLAAIMATQAYRLEKHFSLKKLIRFAIVMAVVLFWGMTIKGVEKYAFVILSGIEGLLFVVMGDYINKRIPSDKRATILSFSSMIFSFFMILLFPVVGKLGDIYGLATAFILVAICGSTALLGLLYMISKHSMK